MTFANLDHSARRNDEIAAGVEVLGYEILVKDLAVVHDCHTWRLNFHKSKRK